MVLNQDLSGYCMMYRAVHGDEDENPDDKWKDIL
jgi:hypothetical protein